MRIAASVIGFAVASVLGFGLTQRLTSHEPPKDQFGYTIADQQSFVAGCGGGARCECLFSAIERAIKPERFLEVSQEYMRTGAMSDDVLAVVVQAGC